MGLRLLSAGQLEPHDAPAVSRLQGRTVKTKRPFTLSATGPGPFIRVPWSLLDDDPSLHNPKKLAAWIRERVEEDMEKRRRRRTYISPLVWNPILEAFDYACAYCGIRDVPLEKDHRVPVSKGGTDDPANLVPACKPCNVRKHADDPQLWPIRFPA